MKRVQGSTTGTLYILLIFALLSGCCGLCHTCPDSEYCERTVSNPAINIESSAGQAGNTSASDTAATEGWRFSYPMFEGDYFSVTLPIPLTASSGGTETTTEEEAEGSSESVARTRRPEARLHPDTGPGVVTANSGGNNSSTPVQDTIVVNARIKSEVKNKVTATIALMGFADASGGVLEKEFSAEEPYVVKSAGGDILGVAKINCQLNPTNEPGSFCDLIKNGQKEKAKKLIEQATGMSASDYLDRRLIRFFFFQRPQYRQWPTDPDSSRPLCPDRDWHPTVPCRHVVIEHTAIVATSSPKMSGAVTSVSGRLFPSYRITNKPRLSALEAVNKAYEHLWRIPEISKLTGETHAEHNPALVLLPYEYARRLDLGRIFRIKWPIYKTPQLRYAYRTTLYGDFVDGDNRRVDGASWRAWVDAETGDILQLIPLFDFASGGVDAIGKGWGRPPSHPINSEDLPKKREFKVDPAVGGPGQYCLKLEDVFEMFIYDEPPNDQGVSLKIDGCITVNIASEPIDFEKGLSCLNSAWDCLCRDGNKTDAIRYLLMNAYAHIYDYKAKLDAAICLTKNGLPLENPALCDLRALKVVQRKVEGSTQKVNVPLWIKIEPGETRAYYSEEGEPHLRFANIHQFFEQACDSSTSQDNGWSRPAAQDASVMIHEFAHVLINGLLLNWCGQLLECPESQGYGIFHDLADGLSAVSNRTDWFGKWWKNFDDERNRETSGSPRRFEYAAVSDADHSDNDHFPEHREWNAVLSSPQPDSDIVQISFNEKAYADGQIAAAALWAVTDAMDRGGNPAGLAAFEANLLNLLPYHFRPNACSYSYDGGDCDANDNCDLDVYRYLHFLLKELISNERAAQIKSSASKVIAGFAKAGVFLVPPQCIGASTGPSQEGENSYCPSGPYGGDAIIDVEITDNWLKHGSGPGTADIPSFEIWTGPRFQFDGDDAEVKENSLPCNPYFKVSIANNPQFYDDPPASLLSKETDGWLSAQGCTATWPPQAGWDASWQKHWDDIAHLSRTQAKSKVYYRVVTSDSNSTNSAVLSSSEDPGKLFGDGTFDPPFAILNNSGEPPP